MQSLKIALIGLGNMGSPIARNLMKSGFSLSLFNRTISKAEVFRSPHVNIATSIKQAVENVDVLITMLSDDHALKSVSEEAITFMKPGGIHLSMSTVSPAIVNQLLPFHDQYKIKYVAGPVMGRPPAAEARMLFVLLAGDNAAKEKLKPVFEAISQRTFDFGEMPTAAHAAKLALNLMIFTNVELLSEVMLFAERQGLNKNVLFETITNTQLNSPAVKLYGDLILKEQDAPGGFATKLANKDVTLVKQAALDKGLHLPLAEMINHHFNETINKGNGDKDVSLLITHLREKLSKQ